MGVVLSKRNVGLLLGLLFAALVTAAAFIASTYEDTANAQGLKYEINK
jgi:hypothetical protein